MTDMQLAHLSFGGESRDRNREHLIAMREARATTEFRSAAASIGGARLGIAQRLGAVRLRLSLLGGPAGAADACNCPA